jgi:hypothetical protein
MKAMNSEVAKVVEGAKKAQAKLHTALKKQDWIEEARKYAEGQRKEVKKLISGDMAKVKTFLEKERKQLEKIQSSLPVEVKKLRGFVLTQRKEFEKLLKNLRKAGKKQAAGAKKKSSGVRKKASA